MKKTYTLNYFSFSKIKIVTTLLFLFALSSLNAQSPTVFTASGTWICPQGVTSVQVEAWGGGGGGGGAANFTGYRGAGGGGGAYQKTVSLAVTPGQSYTVTIGNSGIAGSTTVNGGAGGNTTFRLGVTALLTANGGNGGQTQTTATAPTAGAGGIGLFNGGNGFIGTTTTGGGGGGGAGASSNGTTATNATGAAAGTGGTGTGGNGGACSGNNSGCPGVNYGGGGGGGNRSRNGGAGASGYVRITFTCPTNTIAAAGLDQTLSCATSTTLAGNTPTYGTGTWTVVSGTATITAPNSPTSTVTGLTIGSSATLRWTIDNGRCGSTSDDVIINTPGSVGCWAYCTANATTVFAISSVSFNTINNAVVGTTGYQNFTAISTTLTAGYTYTMTINVIGNGNAAYTSVWFDWNNNGNFDTGEETQLGTYTTGTFGFTVPITVPITAVTGTTRMRVINRVLTGYSPACGTIANGQIEDYTLNIVAPPSCTTPTAQPTALVLSPSGTSLSGSFTAASPAPNNYLVVINTTGTTPTPTNGATYTIGSAITGGTVVDIDNNTSFVATGLSVSTVYYVFVFSYNSICTGTPLYLGTSPLNGSTTTLATSYCVPTGSLDCTTAGDYIANVTFNTMNNSSTCSPGGYINYAATAGQTTTLLRGNTYNLSIRTGPGNRRHGAAVWIDLNQNGSFADAGEYFLIGNNVIANSTNTIAVGIPAGATLGQTRMRIRYAQRVNITSAMSCTMTGNFGETEDYTVTIANSVVCTAPTTQPTSLILNSTGTTISGSFTAAVPAPNNYLVVINTTGITPTPSNGTTYTIGGAIIGGTVVDTDANTIFTANSLTTLTTYYIFVFSYNSICTGGPTYNLTSPLTDNIATINSNYCIPSVTSGRENINYLTEVSFIGTLNDMSNFSTFSSTPVGYQDFTGLVNLSRQAQGDGVNVSIQATYSSYIKAWIDWDKNGIFDNNTEIIYNSGTIATGSTTFGFVIPANQALGNYRLRVRVDERIGGSTTFTSCGNLNNEGETEDYLFTVVAKCNAIITGTTDGSSCGPGTVALEATSAVVTPAVSEFRWYTTPTGATLVGTTPTGSWTTPSINTTTSYYVTAYNGCESLTRTEVKAFVNAIPNLTFLPLNPISCGQETGVALSATGGVEEVYLIDEEFNTGLGTFTNTNITSSVRDANTQWQNRTSTYIPTAISGTNTWYPAIASGNSSNSFVMATSDFADAFPYVQNQITSSATSTVNFTSLTLKLRMFYSRYFIDGAYPAEEYVTIDVSTNNGTNWIEIKRFTEDIGIGTKFEDLTYDLSAYVGVNQFKVRVRYYTNNWCDGIAIDDIQLYGNRPNNSFNWSTTLPTFSDAACTIPYIPLTPAAVIYVKPTFAQLQVTNFNFTVNAFLDNACSTSQVISITNNTKFWNGTDSSWDDDENWMPLGKPTSANCIVIPNTGINPVISGSDYDAFAKNITINNGANLTIESENKITITDEVIVKSGGVFDIKNSGSLIQINDSAINSGSIRMTRTTRPMTRWSYVYWGSPIVEDAFGQIPSQFDYKYEWQSGTSTGTWSGLSSVSQGKGFIARVSNIAPFSTGTGTIDFIFNGTPGNGVVNVPVDSFDANSLVAGNTVLLANPYPSAIDAASFLTNSNNTELGGTLFFWTSITTYTGNGTYNILDYGSWNLSGGTGTAPATDPSNTGLKPNGKIAAGQGFFAQVFADGNITFNNSMRSADFNNQFFRTVNPNTGVSEDNRIWLNLYSDTNFRQMLVNYKAEATNGYDRLYDGNSFTNNEIDLYSVLDSKKLVIQGRGLPFDENDIVPLGYRVTNAGVYNIAIDELDGLFAENQSVYLRDNLLGIDHNIKESAYSFTTTVGTFDNRFELVYVTNALGVTNPDTSTTFASINHNTIKVETSEYIKNINIYDISGKLINRYDLGNASKQLSDSFNYPNGIYIAEITLENGIVVKKKLIH